MNASQAMNAYKSVGVQSAVEDASPHHLIGMLFDGALDRIASAKGAMERGDTGVQGALLGKAITIIDNMRASLDHQQGGDLAGKLADLYDYMERRLLEAGTKADPKILDEVSSLLREVKSGWDQIPEDLRR
ncbi:flagellar export chaperone FliS [Congregibacter variabilis]|uniref:Flagellar secretion chaperone FliS n=1 Tax=Congregibacter variabilis TaxID=3081200 RepID=A0ABZ0I292_9GAMM|nr:flagellar export chaperone FliS [Congregibacter sp. IMCC43200]